jgi:hypothetical protein
MAGRKPLELAHVDALDGSDRAKQRMRAFLETLQGTLAVEEACQRLSLHESHFHEARRRWLQASLALLEPQRVGRPPREEPSPLALENKRLSAEAAALREELRGAIVRQEIAQILGAPANASGSAPMGAGKKTDPPRAAPRTNRAPPQ